MIIENSSLLTRYETLRRKEHEQMMALLDTLGKVDGLPDGQMDQARDALFHANTPYLVVLMGAFNTGKSSIINALVGAPILTVGATPTTSQITILRHGETLQRTQAGDEERIFSPAPLLEKVSIVDTPGLDSIFKGHDETTRRFLHRADIVMVVMMSTQAMSASNVEYLQALKAYGKRIIVIINQIDLLDVPEQATLKTFVADQSKIQLGLVLDVWMVSARLALEAQQSQPRNEELWQQSGFEQIIQFINKELSDVEREKQKLQTPLQIARNVLSVANTQVQEQQDALADHRRAAQNVKGQIDAALHDQQLTMQQTLTEISEAFAEAMRRGREAINDVFQWSKAFALAIGGLFELIGLSRLFRRFGRQTPARAAFEARRVNEPLDSIPQIVDRLGPRLEGRDVKDGDDLIGYTRREIEALPESLRGKLVGKLEMPSSYDRSIMRNARDSQLALLDKAKTVEFQRIDSSVRNSIIVLGIYEVVVILGGLAAIVATAGSPGGPWALALLLTILLALGGGFGLPPIMGALMARAYVERMRQIKEEFERGLNATAQQQIAYGKQMRQDAVAPFMRLVEAQVTNVDTLKQELQTHEQNITSLEKELGGLRG